MKDGQIFKASHIKRDLTFTNIIRFLNRNSKKEKEP